MGNNRASHNSMSSNRIIKGEMIGRYDGFKNKNAFYIKWLSNDKVEILTSEQIKEGINRHIFKIVNMKIKNGTGDLYEATSSTDRRQERVYYLEICNILKNGLGNCNIIINFCDTLKNIIKMEYHTSSIFNTYKQFGQNIINMLLNYTVYLKDFEDIKFSDKFSVDKKISKELIQYVLTTKKKTTDTSVVYKRNFYSVYKPLLDGELSIYVTPDQKRKFDESVFKTPTAYFVFIYALNKIWDTLRYENYKTECEKVLSCLDAFLSAYGVMLYTESGKDMFILYAKEMESYMLQFIETGSNIPTLHLSDENRKEKLKNFLLQKEKEFSDFKHELDSLNSKFNGFVNRNVDDIQSILNNLNFKRDEHKNKNGYKDYREYLRVCNNMIKEMQDGIFKVLDDNADRKSKNFAIALQEMFTLFKALVKSVSSLKSLLFVNDNVDALDDIMSIIDERLNRNTSKLLQEYVGKSEEEREILQFILIWYLGTVTENNFIVYGEEQKFINPYFQTLYFIVVSNPLYYRYNKIFNRDRVYRSRRIVCYSWFTAYLLLYGDIMENTLNENKVTQQNMYDICWNLYKDIVRSENIFVEKGSFDDLKDIINFDRNNAFKISDKPIRVKDLVSYNLRF